MRNWILLGSIAALVGCGSSGSGTGVTCGDGTTLVGDTCQPDGSDTTCGTGTHLDGTMCVPDAPGATGAPTIASIDPTNAGVSGSVLFTITGTGFAGQDVTDLHVFFGNTSNPNCEAQVGAATATTIAGEVPAACDLTVVVTVQTNIGSATTPFQYDALFAADGDGGGATGQAGDIYLIDPFAQVFYDLGPMLDTTGTVAYGMSGLAFSSTGTLYGVTTGDSPADVDFVSQLVTFDLTNGAVSAVGDALDSGGNGYIVTDIKMTGTTLYGWAYWFAGEGVNQGVVTISTTDATVTPLSAGVAETFGFGSLAIDGSGTVFVAASGAGADAAFAATGELDRINTTTGAATSVGTLDYPIGAPVQAMTYVGTSLVGVVDNGTYGMDQGQQIYGETLAVIDTTQSPIVQPQFELPAQLGAQSHIDAIEMAPGGLTLARRLVQARWSKLEPAGTVSAHAPGARPFAPRQPSAQR